MRKLSLYHFATKFENCFSGLMSKLTLDAKVLEPEQVDGNAHPGLRDVKQHLYSVVHVYKDRLLP